MAGGTDSQAPHAKAGEIQQKAPLLIRFRAPYRFALPISRKQPVPTRLRRFEDFYLGPGQGCTLDQHLAPHFDSGHVSGWNQK
jgi:hypothetical protein